MANRRVSIDVFEVGLENGPECAIHHTDTSENKENPGLFLGSFGHQIHGYPESAVTSQFHQYAGVEHRNSGRR